MCDTVAEVRRATSRPRWLGLYAATLPQLVALAVVEIAGPPSAVRAVARCVFALGTFAAMGCWVHASRAALDLQQWCECARRSVTVRVIESRRPEHPHRMAQPVMVRSEADEDTLVGV
jgi:hypothetical protein